MTTPAKTSLTYVALLLLVLEAVFNAVIIERVPYTEIDWVAYMQEVAPVVHNATYDYSVLKGDTGPLVYPAGFVWFFSGLYHLTDQGENIKRAQYIFTFLYLIHLALVFRIMARTEKVPPYALVFMSLLTKRIHSIFVLRLFNDPVATLFLYAAVNLFMDDRWSLGSLCFSLAVSVKMNILLYAPALFLVYLATQGFVGTIVQLTICALPQIVLALPFLLENPVAYVMGAFDFGRVFMHKWTVNFRFVDEAVFVSKSFHLGLLVLHILVLLLCAQKWWRMATSYAKLRRADGPSFSAQLLVLPLFMSNFIGVVFARSLHYQFYVWYFHQLHYLLWCTGLPAAAKLLVLGLVELCWNVYPSTAWSSLLLHSCHFVLLGGLLANLFGISAYVGRKKKS